MTSTVIDPRLTPLYVHELMALAVSVRDNCDAVFLEAPVPPKGGYIKVSPRLHATINQVLIGAANIKKLLSDPTTAPAKTKGKPRGSPVVQVQRDRANNLASVLAGIDLSAILDIKVRNTLEHFEEYLDESLVEISAAVRKKGASSQSVAFNLALSHWGVLKEKPYPLRLYVADERRFYNFKSSANLGSIRDEASAIVLRLTSVFGIPEEQGGLLVILTPPPRTAG